MEVYDNLPSAEEIQKKLNVNDDLSNNGEIYHS